MTDVSTTWVKVIFWVKWIVFVSRWCYKVGSLNVIGQLSHDGIGWKTRIKFVISHWWVSILLLLVKLVGFWSVLLSQSVSVCQFCFGHGYVGWSHNTNYWYSWVQTIYNIRLSYNPACLPIVKEVQANAHWTLSYLSPGQGVAFLGNTINYQCLSPLRCVNGYQWTTWQNVGGWPLMDLHSIQNVREQALCS